MECEDCFHVQTSEVLEDFSNYPYQTPKALIPYLDEQAQELHRRYPDVKTVVEIGCNNGVNCEVLGKYFDSVIGVDPANTFFAGWKEPFTLETAKRIKEKNLDVRLIVANHVFAHIDDLDQVFEGIDYLLPDDGVLVFEVGDFGRMTIKGQYDTIYHEHLDQHTKYPWIDFLGKYRLQIENFEYTESQGGSLRIYCERGSYRQEDWQRFRQNINWGKYDLRIKANQAELLYRLPERFCIWGASAKATTLIHQLGIKDRILWCEDNTPSKQGLYLPGTEIKILTMEHDKENMPALLTAWNFEEEFKKQYPDREYLVPYA